MKLYQIEDIVYFDRIRSPVYIRGVSGRIVYLEEYSTRRLKYDERYHKFILWLDTGVLESGWFRDMSQDKYGNITISDPDFTTITSVHRALSAFVAALTVSRVSGEDMIKGLRAWGIELKTKLTQNYLGGWMISGGAKNFSELFDQIVDGVNASNQNGMRT